MYKWIALSLMLCLCMGLFGCAQAEDKVEITVLKIGKADAIMIIMPEYAMLIDAGEEDDGEEILEKLAARGVKKLDTMIITHYDKDHVGGAATVLSGIRVDQLIDADYESDSKHYERYLEAIEATGVARERANANISFGHGDVWSMSIAPSPVETDEDNDRSLIARFVHGKNTFYFAGDAEEALIETLLDDGIDPHTVLKMPHHGRMKKNLAAFLNAVSPGYAIITDSDKNPADPAVLALLDARDIKVFETRNGDISVFSDGEGIDVVQ